VYYTEAINRIDNKLRADVQYNDDGTYEILWDDVAYKAVHGVDQVHPSVADIEAMHTTVKAEMDALAYQGKRQEEYPSIEDVTVALAEKAEGDSTMWDEITAKRQAIKIKYPKG
ncbi:uncharacterized protein METZ01_LOCUS195886, partial [marine metagenome]